MKIEQNTVIELMKREQVEQEKTLKIASEMKRIAEAEKEAKNPHPKKEYVILVTPPNAHGEQVGWAVQIEESESPLSIMDKIHAAAFSHNESKKGRLLPVRTIGEVMESVPARICKDAGFWVKTKTPVYILPVQNQLKNEKDAE